MQPKPMKRALKKIILCLVLILIITSFSIPQQINSNDENSILSFINKFSDKDPFINGEAIASLVKMGSVSVDYLIKTLKDINDTVRVCSAIALAEIAPEGLKAIPFLTEALKDKNSEVRWYSAIALGRFQKEAVLSVQPLLSLLNDDDRDVRWAAYISLIKVNKEAINKPPDFAKIIEILEKFTPQLIKELKVPGVSISVIKNYKLEWSKCFGVCDAIKQNEVKNNSIFEACSMSKPVFTFIVLKLAEEGMLDLDKPLSNYLPEQFVSDDDKYPKLITARMVLTHTGGMPNWRKGGEERGGPIPIYNKPGTKFNYSGEGVYYLQRVVEQITKEPLERYAKRNLFDKLGLESTSFVITEGINPQIVTGHDKSGNCKKRSYYKHSNAAYTLYTTADDYAKFIIEIMKHDKPDKHSLSTQMTNEMLSHQIRADVREVIDRPGRSLGLLSFRGLGWGIDSTITGDIIYHSGANQTGFRCYSQFNMREGSGIVIMTNGENGSELWTRIISTAGDL
jgi:CubicO group peptidase (beta-lactamase class C family)